MTVTFVLISGIEAKPKFTLSLSDHPENLNWSRVYGLLQWSVWAIVRNEVQSGIPVMLAKVDMSKRKEGIDARLEHNAIIANTALDKIKEYMSRGGWEESVVSLERPLFIYT
jgi:hypothetical protein